MSCLWKETRKTISINIVRVINGKVFLKWMNESEFHYPHIICDKVYNYQNGAYFSHSNKNNWSENESCSIVMNFMQIKPNPKLVSVLTWLIYWNHIALHWDSSVHFRTVECTAITNQTDIHWRRNIISQVRTAEG